jgi:hypothetical protein
MKIFRVILAAVLMMTVAVPNMGFALSDQDRAEFAFQNYLAGKNPGFENGKAGWTASGGTFSTATSGSNYMGIGRASGTWDSSSAGQTLTSPAFTVTNGAAGNNALARCKVMTPSGTATHTMGLWDGTNLTNTISIPSSTTAQYVEIPFPMGAAASTVAIRFTSVASNEPLISIDDCYIGPNFNLSNGQPITDWASFTPTGTWTANSTYTGKWRRVGDVAEYQVTITASGAPTATQLYINLPTGHVIDTAKLASTANNPPLGFGMATDSGVSNYPVRVDYDSTTRVSVTAVGTASTYASTSGLTATIPFTFGNADSVDVLFRVPIATWGAQSAIRADNSDFDWTSYTPTYVGLGSPTGTAYYRRVGDSVEVQFNFTAGTVTSSAASISLPSGLTINSSKFNSTGMAGYWTANSFGATVSTHLIADSGTSVINFGLIVGSSNGFTKALGTSIGTGAIVTGHTFLIPVTGWTTSQRAPLLVGSVTSNTTGLERVERATISSSTPSVSSQSGSWISSVSRPATGQFTLTLASGIFSGIPSCVANVSNGGAGNNFVAQTSPGSTTSVNVAVANAGTATNADFQVICMGPR